MTQKNFNTIAGSIFLLAAVIHLWRVVYGLPVNIGTTEIAMWVSWAAIILGTLLGFYGIKHGKK